MQRFRSYLVLFMIYAIGVLTGTFMTGILLIYVGMSWLHQPHRSDNENVRQVLQWGRVYALELNQLEDLQKSVSLNTNHMCESLCLSTNLKADQLLAEGPSYLADYWASKRSESLKDPFFVLALSKIEVLAPAFPRALRDAILEPYEPSRVSRLLRASALEWQLGTHIFWLATNWKSLLDRWTVINNYQDDVKSCREGLQTRANLIEKCRSSLR